MVLEMIFHKITCEKMKKLNLLILAACFPVFGMAQTKENPIQWIGKPNRIGNPGAEANNYGKPELW